jgi:hypothetical protein
MREETDNRAEQFPVTSLDHIFEEAERRHPKVNVSEFKPPHDRETTWKKTKQATLARKKAASRAAKPTIKKKISTLLKPKQEEGEMDIKPIYLLGGLGALAGLVFLMKR